MAWLASSEDVNFLTTSVGFQQMDGHRFCELHRGQEGGRRKRMTRKDGPVASSTGLEAVAPSPHPNQSSDHHLTCPFGCLHHRTYPCFVSQLSCLSRLGVPVPGFGSRFPPLGTLPPT